jgi:hypothetical protein
MTIFKDHVLEPRGPGRRLDPYYRRFGKLCVKLSHLLKIMQQIKSSRLTRRRIAPGYCLLMRMKINSDV